MTPRRTRAKDLKRRTAVRPERKTIVIFCEGENSEPDYIKGLKRLPHVQRNAAVNIEIHPEQGVPLTLVQMAADRKQRDREVDECWCVFDVEWPKQHPNLDRALTLARSNDIRVAISNPCFELWLILHFENQTGFLDTDAAESRSRKLDGRAGKHIDPAVYLPRRTDAAGRSATLASRHAGNGTSFPNDNPSSTMHDLLAAIEPPAQ